MNNLFTESGDSALAGNPPSTQHGAIRSALSRPEQAGEGANPNTNIILKYVMTRSTKKELNTYTWRIHAQQRAQRQLIQRICIGLFVLIALVSTFVSCAAAWPARAQTEVEQHKSYLILIHAPVHLVLIGDPCRDMTECVTQQLGKGKK